MFWEVDVGSGLEGNVGSGLEGNVGSGLEGDVENGLELRSFELRAPEVEGRLVRGGGSWFEPSQDPPPNLEVPRECSNS